MNKVVMLSLLIFCLTGCFHATHSPLVTIQAQEIDAAIIKNKTTVQELINRWGQPTQQQVLHDRIIVNFYHRGSTQKSRHVYINVYADKNWVVTDYNYSIVN